MSCGKRLTRKEKSGLEDRNLKRGVSRPETRKSIACGSCLVGNPPQEERWWAEAVNPKLGWPLKAFYIFVHKTIFGPIREHAKCPKGLRVR